MFDVNLMFCGCGRLYSPVACGISGGSDSCARAFSGVIGILSSENSAKDVGGVTPSTVVRVDLLPPSMYTIFKYSILFS